MTTEPYKTVLLCGAPGAGKGTQGKILGSIPGFFHLSCGDVFRTININSELGQKICEYTSRGDLVPDDITVELWQENMNARTVLNDYKPNVDLLVLDGIPRNVLQAELLTSHIEVLMVLHLICRDKDKMIERLRRRALKENRPTMRARRSFAIAGMCTRRRPSRCLNIIRTRSSPRWMPSRAPPRCSAMCSVR